MGVFTDYGLGFRQADFSGLTQGVGGYYSNKAKRDRFADLEPWCPYCTSITS